MEFQAGRSPQKQHDGAPQVQNVNPQQFQNVQVGESPRASVRSVQSHQSLMPPGSLQPMPSRAVSQAGINGGGDDAPPQERTSINIMDTDVGELLRVPQNPRWKEFAVEKPMKSNDYITYEVTGYDLKGNFQVRKRYSDFYMLRKALRERWPGYYIPAIPPKKALGNMETEFIRARLAFLDNFVKQLGQYAFLVDSFEFSCFVRNSGDELQEQYTALLQENPQQIKEKYMQICPIDPMRMPREQRMNCVIVLQKFQTFVSQAIRNLQGHKSEFMELEKKRATVNKNYQTLYQKLTEYEMTGLDFYTDSDPKQRVFGHPNHEYEHMIDGLQKKLGNPYSQIINWIKKEIYDLQGLEETIQSVKTIEKTITSTKKDIAGLKEYVEDLNNKKTSFGTIWRTVTFRSMSVDECMTRIFTLETSVDGWEQILEYITYYIPMSIFPRFKRDRGGQYLQFMADYAEEHAEGADQNIEIWEKIAFFAQTEDERKNDFMLTDQIREEIAEEEEQNEEEERKGGDDDQAYGGHQNPYMTDDDPYKTEDGDEQNNNLLEEMKQKKAVQQAQEDDEDDDDLFEKPPTQQNPYSQEELAGDKGQY